MKVHVLRDFPYAADKLGVVVAKAAVGTEIEMWDDAVEGLIKEGYVRAVVAQPAAQTERRLTGAATSFESPAAPLPSEDAPRKGKGSKK